MSVSDPLIKDIKASADDGCVQHFMDMSNTATTISDNNIYLLHFVHTIETIFDSGLIRQQNTKFFDRTIDPFSWMTSVDQVTFAYKTCTDSVKKRQDVHTKTGKFRLLIRYCLVKKCLHVPVEALMKSQHAHVFYISGTVLGDEILSEILLSVLLQVGNLKFELDLTNASFLDTSWYLPSVLDLELVPCTNLGIAVSFAGNKAVIVKVEPDSVAAEHGKIKLGDVLDQLNGVQIDSGSKGRLRFIMKNHKLKPVQVRIVKAYDLEVKQLYPPIQNLLRELKIDFDSVRKQYEENGNNIVNVKQSGRIYGYSVKYLATVDVGDQGSVKQIQQALRAIANTHSPEVRSINRVDKESSLEIGEIGLKIRDKDTGDLTLEHSYMKISSCGNLPILPKVFGYCAGEEACDVAKQFFCYIFEAGSADEADLILQSIGQGFHRTHFAV